MVIIVVCAPTAITETTVFCNRDNLFIPFVSALCGLTVLPVVMSFILALLSTGYARNVIYFYHFQKCTGVIFTMMVSVRG